ncbi:piggyBac transposable element-derived protein 4-like [Cimex lectularius]|uniref:PiggyBac transposable element-derived protein domain-containing protein n=1 Tax=Cimex lectularius TaxID=79782 RepID=A0A8I6S9M2_CIMLE|nr:piggyBac transposable element-derived protein 4-like [Cimex lectularius]XP_014259126.1 piggyBac transposable element-derived protein 4-like [Cimex lectularius]XP_014259127.1 piggyBac transposable element-derived protein 4-like [Cimex lectularius]XP_024081962.1 piggyBac transposable element-derived protein 4-like [Cimex lectularius]
MSSIKDNNDLNVPGPSAPQAKKIKLSSAFCMENFLLSDINKENVDQILEELSGPTNEDDQEAEGDEDDEKFEIGENNNSPLKEVDISEVRPRLPLSTLPSTKHSVNQKNDPPSTRPFFPFTGNGGIFHQDQTPDKYFDLLFTDQFLDNIVTETNRHATHLMMTSKLKNWKDLTRDELKIFLGIYFHMGIIKISGRITAYWDKSYLYNMTFFQRLSQDRFLGILQCLHFAKNPAPNEEASKNPLYKLAPVLVHFHKTMTDLDEPGREILVPWRGRLFFRSYIPNKVHKYVIKLYMLAENDGLIHRFLVYAGVRDPKFSSQGHIYKVVHKLLDGLKNTGRSLFVDNFYTSVVLADQHQHEETLLTGTLMANRKDNPTYIITKKLSHGEVVQHWTNTGIKFAKWKDKRNVLTISTEFAGDLVNPTSQRGIQKQTPEALYQYNSFICGIDHCDQMISYYIGARKSLKWYKKLGFHIMEVLLLNAYLLYKRYSVQSTTLNLLQFRENIIKYLVPPLPSDNPMSSPSSSRRDIIHLSSTHFPTSTKNSEGSRGGRKSQKRCRQCSKSKVQKMTTLYCPSCPNEPGLCLECFLPFHKENGFLVV